MEQNNRRSFIKATTLGLGILGVGSMPAFAADTTTNVTPPEVTKKTVYLWPDNSPNNGKDPLKRPKLDFFIPKTVGDQKRAAIIACPGGGYGSLSKQEGDPFSELFAAHGIVGITLTYRYRPNRYPAPMADAARAIRLIRSQAAELNIDPDKIGIIGFSAGGHLVSTMATQPNLYIDPLDDLAAAKVSARPDRLMMGYPVISFEEFANVGSLKNLLGDNLSPDLLRQLSNQYQVTADTPPTFIFHTAEDTTVVVQNSLVFAEACVRNKVPIALHIYPHGRHGIGLALNNPELSSWSEVLLKWLSDWQTPVV